MGRNCVRLQTFPGFCWGQHWSGSPGVSPGFSFHTRMKKLRLDHGVLPRILNFRGGGGHTELRGTAVAQWQSTCLVSRNFLVQSPLSLHRDRKGILWTSWQRCHGIANKSEGITYPSCYASDVSEDAFRRSAEARRLCCLPWALEGLRRPAGGLRKALPI